MQSLEEDALLKGTLAAQQQPECSRRSPCPSPSSMIMASGDGEVLEAAARGSGKHGEDSENPQTDGDETDDYSDQVSMFLGAVDRTCAPVPKALLKAYFEVTDELLSRLWF